MPSAWLNRSAILCYRCIRYSRSESPALSSPPWRRFHQGPNHNADVTSLRKQLKDANKAARTLGVDRSRDDNLSEEILSQWQLTVGIEIHAQLNTARKLFSKAPTESCGAPNTSLADFDIALPGSQPVFQTATLIPALRAALALNCTIQTNSRFDRKHYFYHDQPSGYQITQYYRPFATNGFLLLTADDGLPPEDGDELMVGIKQVQMEQDTAKTQEQEDGTSLIDFRRSGQPLIEIISLPHIHSAEAAAAYMRKVQAIMFAVDAVTTGMELGGLRADVNVSVRRIGEFSQGMSYGGVEGLGQRTEIKNLSSFKAVEDAVKAERDRQIRVLSAGGLIEGETRGWSLTTPGETRRLRGKEGEVDYRYMPDPDIAPLHISDEVITFMRETMPPVPQQLIAMLIEKYGLSSVDAKSLLALEDGQRLVYFQSVVDHLTGDGGETSSIHNKMDSKTAGKVAGNWVLHELGSLLSTTETAWTPSLVPANQLARIIQLQALTKVTGTSAKRILRIVFDGDKNGIDNIVSREALWFEPMSDAEYQALADLVIQDNPSVVKDIQEKGKHSKMKFLTGQMMQRGDRSRMEASKAEILLSRTLLV